jgi:glyoxylase-like metal-dependent hydrolase (beta-lactamase superfamily II)
MSKGRKRLLVVLGVLLGLGIPGYWWLFLEDHAPDGTYTIDLAEVRKLASSMPGDKPTEIRFETVTHFNAKNAFTMAGAPWSPVEMTVYAYQLVFPTHRAMVDTALDEKTAKEGGGEGFDNAAWQHLVTAMTESDLIVVTHEHYDHIGGLSTAPNAKELVKKSKVTKQQLQQQYQPWKRPTEPYEGFTPFDYDKYAAVAPGVVLIRAPGHTVGAQMVYVQRADGAELIFLGDVAWRIENVEQQRERARLVTTIMTEDRNQVGLELRELHRLTQAEPKLTLVPGHDAAYIAKLVAAGLLKPGFVLGPIAAPDAVPAQ